MKAVELQEKLDEGLLEELGLNPKFKSNPEFSHIMSSIRSDLAQKLSSCSKDWLEYLSVKTEKELWGIIMSFDIENQNNSYSFELRVSASEFSVVEISKDLKPSSIINGQNVSYKSADERVIQLDEYGRIKVTQNHSAINDYKDHNLIPGNSYNDISTTIHTYDSNGIEVKREELVYANYQTRGSVSNMPINSMLHKARKFAEYSYEENYTSRRVISRKGLDFAECMLDDKNSKVKYIATLPITLEHTPRYLRVDEFAKFNQFPTNIEILPKTQEEIERTIQTESDPKVVEGLRKYAEGRESFYYNSSEDKNFVYEGEDGYSDKKSKVV